MAIIIVTEANKRLEELMHQRLQGHDLRFFDAPIQDLTEQDYRDADVLSVFVHSRVSSDLIAKMPNLSLITTRSTGVDHIDAEAAKARDITLTSVPRYGEVTVAEYTIALLLAISRKVHKASRKVAKGSYSNADLQGFDLYGKRLGLLGGGSIGMHVVRIAKGFGMDVVVYDIIQHEDKAKELGFRYTSMEEVVASSDVISLHMPETPQTHHMINSDRLDAMRDGVIIINTARGGLIDVKALKTALESGKVAAAGLDVIEEEVHLGRHDEMSDEDRGSYQAMLDVITHPNVLFTPHNAFNSAEAIQRIYDTTIDNIRNQLE